MPEDGPELITENIHTGTQITTKPLEAFQQTDTKFAKAYDKLYTKNKEFASKGKQDFVIFPDKVVKIEENGHTTYTILVHREGSPEGSFDNLLIDIDDVSGHTKTYLINYLPDENGIVYSDAHESFNFKGGISINQIAYDVSGLLSERIDCRIITMKFCDWGGSEHVAGDGCTPDYIYDRTFQECDWVPGGDDETETGGTGVPGSEDPDGPGDPGHGGGGPGGGGSTTPVPWGEEEAAIMEYVISELSLSFKEKQWVRSYPNLKSVVNIYNFLERYDSEEAEDFAEYAIEVLMANPDANPFLGADCRSFEYAQPPGALQKGCAVKDFNHTFYTAGINSDGNPYYGEIDSTVSIVYFTMPSWMTNGQAANYTAEAVTSAIKATDLYFALNPYASEYTVGDFFKISLLVTWELLVEL